MGFVKIRVRCPEMMWDFHKSRAQEYTSLHVPASDSVLCFKKRVHTEIPEAVVLVIGTPVRDPKISPIPSI